MQRRSATLEDVAREAGVSQQTVSRVLNNPDVVSEKTRDKVIRAMQALRYVPNRSAQLLAGKSAPSIGLITASLTLHAPSQIAAAVNIKDRGIVSRPGLWVLRKTNMPAVLIECAFISNANDRAIMTDESALNAYARSIADGIKQSLETMKQNIIKAKNE